MTRPGGIFKRPPIWIDREQFTAMSKADLADVAWDLALRLVGADDATKAGELINRVHDDLYFYRDQQREELRRNKARARRAQ